MEKKIVVAGCRNYNNYNEASEFISQCIGDIVRQVSQFYFALRQSDIKTFGFSFIIFAPKLPKAISLGRSPNLTAKQYNSPIGEYN